MKKTKETSIKILVDQNVDTDNTARPTTKTPSSRGSTTRGNTPTPRQPSTRNRRTSTVATRTEIRKPRSDHEFVVEYSQYSKPEQVRRLSLINNLPNDELRRRLELLEHTEAQIRATITQQHLPLYDRLGLAGDAIPEFFEEVKEPNPNAEDIAEVFPEDEDETLPQMDIPPWAQQIIAQQTAQLTQLTQLMQNNIGNNAQQAGADRPIRAEYIFEFSPTDSPDDTEYYLFSERITDMVAQYGEAKVLLSLVACLKNSRAKNWYTSLSDANKNHLRTSTQEWKNILKRDFGIKPFRAKQLAQRETFSFSQGRLVLQYFDKKIACLHIAEVLDEDMQCSEVKEGLRDPEYRSAIRLLAANNTLAWLRQELTDLESDCRAL